MRAALSTWLCDAVRVASEAMTRAGAVDGALSLLGVMQAEDGPTN